MVGDIDQHALYLIEHIGDLGILVTLGGLPVEPVLVDQGLGKIALRGDIDFAFGASVGQLHQNHFCTIEVIAHRDHEHPVLA